MRTEHENPYDSPREGPSRAGPSSLLFVLAAIAVLAGTMSIFLLLFLGPFAWILRDGLGPDSTRSAGMHAIQRMFW